MTLASIFCTARDTARDRTLAMAMMPVTSMPSREATIRPSSKYSTTATRERIRLWAAFSSLEVCSTLRTMVLTTRITSRPTARISTAGRMVSIAYSPRKSVTLLISPVTSICSIMVILLSESSFDFFDAPVQNGFRLRPESFMQ